MVKEKFVLVSLQEDKAKKLAQVITNDSCRRILDYLADKESTESELAKNLGLPISTVHYNLKQLVDGGLVVVDEFHYSEKGKEVNHYKIANKYIIIAPKSTWGIKEKLKSLLPVVLIIAAASFILEFFNKNNYLRSSFSKTLQVQDGLMSAQIAQEAAKSVSNVALDESASAASDAVVQTAF